MSAKHLFLASFIFIVTGCGEVHVSSSDVSDDGYEAEGFINAEMIEVAEGTETEVFPEAAEIETVEDADIEEADAAEIPGVKGIRVERHQFSGGYRTMKSAKNILRIGMVNHPLGKRVEIKNSKYRLRAGFISAIKK